MAFTFFFRDRDTLDLVCELILPKLRDKKYINIWDAGCADGPEPYTLAIMLRENMGNFGFRNVRIYASDIDESGDFGNVVNKGIYPNDAITRVDKKIFEKYFQPVSKDLCKIKEEIRKRVSYQKHNLLTYEPIREGLSLIVCKNVLLHFKAEERIEVIKMFHKSLADSGFFVTEQTQKLPDEFSDLFTPITRKGQLFQKCVKS